MFSGIVEAVGAIRRAEQEASGWRLWVGASLGALALGESVCVSGVCLTVVEAGLDAFAVDVSPETLRRSKLGQIRTGDAVNLERSLRLGDRLSGHLVFGHVDGVGRVLGITPEGASAIYRFEAPEAISRYLVEKGSVAVDGVSLTVFHCRERSFSVAVIPHTAHVTTLGRLRPGDAVNLESDMIARYVEKLAAPYAR
ncbi:MAG: riboflavin synthase [Deltaproteobacteria bacterium]|nr:riboflavin synthase [Deltaproteobacteria bacterium]